MKQFLRVGLLLGLAPPIIIFVLTTLFPSFYLGVEDRTYDLRQSALGGPPEEGIKPIILVDIDEKSIRELGEVEGWPRYYYAKITQYLRPCKILGFYIPFFYPELYQYKRLGKDFKGFDKEFIEEVKTHGNVHFAFKLSGRREKKKLPFSIFPFIPRPVGKGERAFVIPRYIKRAGYVAPIDSLLKVAKGIGFGDLFLDPDGRLRTQPLVVGVGNNFYPSFALSIAMQYLEISRIEVLSANLARIKDKRVELEPEIRLRFLSSPKRLQRVSYVDVLHHRVPQKDFKGKIVLVGSSVEDLDGLPRNGVVAQAMLIANIISGSYVKRLGRVIPLIISALLCLSLAFIILRYPPYMGAIYSGALFIAYSIAAWQLFSSDHVWIEIASPLYSFIITGAATFIHKYLTEEREKKRLSEILSKHLPKRAVEGMVRNYFTKGFPLTLTPLTVLTVEIKNLDTLISKSSKEALSIFNEFVERLTPIVFKYNGTLTGYSASGFTASFGAPIPLYEHILVACKVAIEMRREFSLLKPSWEYERKIPVRLGIAIATGQGFVGIFGGDLMVAGEAMDLVMRMASLNRELSSTIIINDKIFKSMERKARIRDLGDISLTHCGQRVKLYELLRMGSEI